MLSVYQMLGLQKQRYLQEFCPTVFFSASTGVYLAALACCIRASSLLYPLLLPWIAHQQKRRKTVWLTVNPQYIVSVGYLSKVDKFVVEHCDSDVATHSWLLHSQCVWRMLSEICGLVFHIFSCCLLCVSDPAITVDIQQCNSEFIETSEVWTGKSFL